MKNAAVFWFVLVIGVLVIAGCGKERDLAGQAYEGEVQAPGAGLPEQPMAVPAGPQCAQPCIVKELTISTNDGETLPLVPGKGGYTAAGAIEWVVEKGPAQCGPEFQVPVKITKRNYGKIVGEDSVTLIKGQTSKIIDHPTIKSLAFTLRLDDVKVQCS